MSDSTPNLDLPYILPAQAQKHVTHNDALRVLDAIVQLAVIDHDRVLPPDDPAEGDRHIVGQGAQGPWAGRQGRIAVFQDGDWMFLDPRRGWMAFVIAEHRCLAWTGDGWQALAGSAADLQNLPAVGVGTQADNANPFAAKLNSTLWTARPSGEGGSGDLRYVLNKEAPGNSLSVLMQSGWSGRAEIGLAGSDDLAISVSADGESWREALVADRSSGAVRLPGGLVHAQSGQVLRGMIFTPGGDGTVSIWRIDAAHVQNPRTETIGSIAGDTITLTVARATQFGRWTGMMEGVSFVRIWNVSKSPAQSAWVKASPTTSTLRVTDDAAIAGWAGGETIQLGDPANGPTGRVIAIDISPMLQALFGAVFRQSGIMVKATLNGDSGDVLALSPSGASGSFVTAAASGVGHGVTIIPCTEPSPISNSNLVLVQERIAGTAGTELVSSIAVFA